MGGSWLSSESNEFSAGFFFFSKNFGSITKLNCLHNNLLLDNYYENTQISTITSPIEILPYPEPPPKLINGNETRDREVIKSLVFIVFFWSMKPFAVFEKCK